jgi:hypothetical protein
MKNFNETAAVMKTHARKNVDSVETWVKHKILSLGDSMICDISIFFVSQL